MCTVGPNVDATYIAMFSFCRVSTNSGSIIAKSVILFRVTKNIFSFGKSYLVKRRYAWYDEFKLLVMSFLSDSLDIFCSGLKTRGLPAHMR